MLKLLHIVLFALILEGNLGHGGGLMRPNSPEMEIASHNKLGQNSRQQPPE
jgi:hypothetical protein